MCDCEPRDLDRESRERESRVSEFRDRVCLDLDFREDYSDLERDREYSTVRLLTDFSQGVLEGVLPLERELD